jgi:hypothetical protein
MTLQPNVRHQYFELLIKLIQANLDQSWLSYFLRLRGGGKLPGGGAGSLNDWGPSYGDFMTQVWYGKIYEVTKYLFHQDLEPNQVNTHQSIKFRDNIRIIRCLNCNKSYQHPSSFESHFALDFVGHHFAMFTDSGRLIEILDPSQTFSSNGVIEYRSWLLNEYLNNDIKVYDFVLENYVCPYCGKQNSDFEHDLYKITKSPSGDKVFKRLKQNASWSDFKE